MKDVFVCDVIVPTTKGKTIEELKAMVGQTINGITFDRWRVYMNGLHEWIFEIEAHDSRKSCASVTRSMGFDPSW